jgi:hypothetical protein
MTAYFTAERRPEAADSRTARNSALSMKPPDSDEASASQRCAKIAAIPVA